MTNTHQLYINGRWQPAVGGGTFASVDPASEQEIAQLAAAGAEDVEQAVSAARAASH